MTTKESPEAAARVLAHALTGDDLPDSFTLLGREWRLHPGVFPSTLTAATEVMASALPYPPGGSFLEMGCGTGVIAVTAALRGCRTVTALDINAKAVANTEENAALHGVADRVRARRSDLFAALGPEDRFDLIFWNVPWTYVDPDYPLTTDLHSAVFDPGYQNQRRFIAEAGPHLTERGRLVLGTTDLGDEERLADAAAEVGMRLHLLRSIRRIEVARVMEYRLLEVVPA